MSVFSLLRCLTAFAPHSACLVLLMACSVPASVAQQPPREVIDACLSFAADADNPMLFTPMRGHGRTFDNGASPPYRLYLPDGDNRIWRVGYAHASGNRADYLFVNSHRGYLPQAIGLGVRAPRRIQGLAQASFALVRHQGWRYLCLMKPGDQRDPVSVRAAFVARIPARMGMAMNLYYATRVDDN